ncbi:unnamed protein product [Triticum aestivum]|uniref:Protein kinase domain-containing protein n=1 Tax=Triticum aestivum TaxID=4565 RepID=A0A7H4LBC7_WHEAT|nr:unnamed protein product [Triticum aestivum]
MMITEYISGGSLREVLGCKDYPISLDQRLGIALDCAKALSYMHSSMCPPTIHGDFKPGNILLDDNFGAKLYDFGISRMFSKDSTQYTVNVIGSIGYLDPLFAKTGCIDPKSDVYSFGVVLVELVTRKKAYENGSMGLIETFVQAVRKGTKAREMFDADIAQSSNIKVLDKIVNLAAECLRMEMSKRPRMEDVAERLRMLIKARCQKGQEKTAGHWTLWGKQDNNTTQSERISSSNSTVFFNLNSLGIFSRNAHTNFKRNGGPVLQNVKGLYIFTKSELRKITNNNSEFLSVGSFGKVCKGTLPENTAVAVMSSVKVTEALKEQFIEQIEIQTHMMHVNILNLIGCCLEVDVPMLVYEFAGKGSLQDILHGNSRNQKLPLDLRLHIAIGTAQGLTYMHSYGNQAIRHGDVKPDNILLDDKFVPKISDFGLWKLLREEYYFGKIVAGDMAYVDPVFLKTGQLTEKSDVYSFGAILLELITRKPSVYDEYCSLILEFRKVCEKEKSGRAMMDKEIATEEEDIYCLEEIGKLAIECLKEDVEDRPDMAAVVERLVMLKKDRMLES